MNIEEIESYIMLGRNRSICVDISNFGNVKGFIRQVTLLNERRVLVEFLPYGEEEGGWRYQTQYFDLHTLIDSIEAYLRKPIDEWENFSKTGNYPTENGIIDEQSIDFMRKTLLNPDDLLPLGANFMLK